MSKSKVLHYASYEAPHEGDNSEYWSLTACGHDYENVTQYEDSVTCKRCLKAINDERLIMVVVNSDDRIVLAGKPRKLTAQECRDYMQPKWSVSTMKFIEYKRLKKKWVGE